MTFSRMAGATGLSERRRRQVYERDSEERKRRRAEAWAEWQEEQERQADEYEAIRVEAWELTDRAGSITAKLHSAALMGPQQFEEARKEAAEFLQTDPTTINGYVYLGNLELALALYGLDVATAERLPVA